jgi:hypothetical protein
MTPIEALHTFARRYCSEQSRLWRERYAASGVSSNSTKAQTIYPHYHALHAILIEVERRTSADFTSLDDTLTWLLLVGQTAKSFFTEMPLHQTGVARQAIDEERNKFAEALRWFVQQADWSVVPMPGRRTLCEQESQFLWARLQERWDVNGVDWYPLRAVSVPDPKVAFCVEDWNNAGHPETLRRLLAAHGVEKLWELRELRCEREIEIELALFDPFYNGSDGYWTSGELDWLVFASHENSITFAGDWLVTEVKAAWPDWEAHRWIAP